MGRFFTGSAALACFVARALLLVALCMAPSISEAAKKKQAKPPPPDLSMRFAIVRASSPLCEPTCPEWIWAEGAIEAGTPARFKAILKTLGKRKLPVIVQSPGGDVDAALAIGRMIRQKGLDVAVGNTNFSSCAPRQKNCDPAKTGGYVGVVSTGFAYCNSACPLMLAGGKKRLVGQWAYLGVHQITTTMIKERVEYRTHTRVVKGKKVVTKKIVGRKKTGSYTVTKMGKGLRRNLEAYLNEMGVSSSIIDRMNATPAADLLQLAPYDMSTMKLITSFDQADMLTGLAICKQQPMPENCREAPMSLEMAAEVAKVAAIAQLRKPTRIAPSGSAQRDTSLPMRFAIVRSGESGCEPNCPEWIAAEGIIQKDSVDLLADVLDRVSGRGLPVVLSSSGGDFDGALSLGRFIRQRGLNTAVGETAIGGCPEAKQACDASQSVGAAYFGNATSYKANCLNTCAFVLAGGVKRVAGQATLLSIEGIRNQSVIRAELKAYLGEMGVDVRLLDGPSAPILSAVAQYRLRDLNLLTDLASVDVFVDGAICKAGKAPDNCRALDRSETRNAGKLAVQPVARPSTKPIQARW